MLLDINLKDSQTNKNNKITSSSVNSIKQVHPSQEYVNPQEDKKNKKNKKNKNFFLKTIFVIINQNVDCIPKNKITSNKFKYIKKFIMLKKYENNIMVLVT